MYFKVGMDGASSQSVYKQKYDENDVNEALHHEQSMFQTAMATLKITIGEKCVWQNKKPNSSHFCRPIHLQYQKESSELCVEEERDLRDQIDRLDIYILDIVNEEGDVVQRAKIKFKIDITMLDARLQMH